MANSTCIASDWNCDVPGFALPGRDRVKGKPSGHCLVAKSIVAHAPPPMCASPTSSPAFGAQSVVIASGPFTCASDLSFEPFADLLRYCEDKRPDSVVLCGPFVDCDHRVVRGDAGVDVSFEKVFEVGVRDRLADFAVKRVRQRCPGHVRPDPSRTQCSQPCSSRRVGYAPAPGTFRDARENKPAEMRDGGQPGTITIKRAWRRAADVLRHLSATGCARGRSGRVRRAIMAGSRAPPRAA